MKAHPDTRNIHEIRKTKGVSWGNLHCLGKSLGSLAQKAHGGGRRTTVRNILSGVLYKFKNQTTETL